MRVVRVYLPLIGAAAAWNLWWGHLSVAAWAASLVGGLLLWTVLEYLIHRFAFHGWAPHWQHHENPTDPEFIFAPLPLSLGSTGALWCLLALATHSWAHGALIAAGTLAGYLAYEWAHLWIHTPRSGNAVLIALRRHHYYHHFADDTKCFGVTSGIWDRIFGSEKPSVRKFAYHDPDTGHNGTADLDIRAAGESPERR